MLREAWRVLRPGGLLILAEIDNTPRTDAKQPIPPGPEGGAPGWQTFWREYRRCAIRRGIDVSVPTRLRSLIQQTGGFERITAQEVGKNNSSSEFILITQSRHYYLLASGTEVSITYIHLFQLTSSITHNNLDPLLLTIGQLAWMDYDILLTSLRPLLLENSSLSVESVDELISAAQSDLYYPGTRLNICLHIVHAIKLV